MSLTVRSALWLMIAAASVASTASAADKSASLPELIEQSRSALQAEKYADSLALAQLVLQRPEFDDATPTFQFQTLQLASSAAWASEDYLTAHEFLVASASFPQADGDLWWRRALLASAVENWPDAALSLTALAEKWPASLKSNETEVSVVVSTVRELRKQPSQRKQREELLNALFDANYKFSLDAEPNLLWLVLAIDSLESKDTKRASEAARRVTDGSVLIAMRIDKRFDALAAAEPKLFDVRAASERSAEAARARSAKHPRSLMAVVHHGYTLYEVGRFKEMLALSESTIAKVEKAPNDAPAYDDVDDNLAWIHNHKASALRALGRWDEAAATLANWRKNARNAGDKASQAINLGFFYNELGRPKDALAAIEGVDWSRDMSDYGRTQLQFVRFQAYQQLGRTAEAQETLNWLREHKQEAPGTAQDALMEAGDADGAAALLIANLRNPDERIMSLAQIQIYASTPRTERQKKLDVLKEALLSRRDVVAAIDAIGRRDRFPIHSMEY